MRINIVWFRRDLRWEDNKALSVAASDGLPILPLFIFDNEILQELESDDARVSFIHGQLLEMNQKLQKIGSSFKIAHGKPVEVFGQLISEFEIHKVYANEDYEPYATERDDWVSRLLKQNGSSLNLCKDQVIFGGNEVLKDDGSPYTVFTAYKRRWLQTWEQTTVESDTNSYIDQPGLFLEQQFSFPALEDLGFRKSKIEVKPFDPSVIHRYDKTRDTPGKATSMIGPHLRFGTVSIRKITTRIKLDSDSTYFSELIWREFFSQILFHFPRVVTQNFRSKYDGLLWRNDPNDFEKWKEGKTGYPFVDAGMRELNTTGFMHNRVRMVTASFLCKHLLIDWRWGEAYFASKLLDYELASNNGNWQWCAGTGCDAAPYFRIFNPTQQLRKFDSDNSYVNTWVPELDSKEYPKPMVDHPFARQRALDAYQKALKN